MTYSEDAAVRMLTLGWFVSVVLVGRITAAELPSAVLPCLADTSIHSFPGDANEPSEWTVRSGASKSIKLKHREDQLLLQFDLQSLPARAKIVSAKLRLFLEGGTGYALNHVCVSTVPTKWDEKTASFLEAAEGRPWGPGNLRFPGVVFGNFGTLTSLAQAKAAGDGWWEIAIAPRVAHALRDSFGLAVMDETGIFAGKFTNILVSSRETQQAPQLVVSWSGEDTVPPSAVRQAGLSPAPDAGSLFLDLVSGGNDAADGTALGYEIRYRPDELVSAANWNTSTVLPRIFTPRPKVPGSRIRTFVEGLEPGTAYSFGVVTYDESGNRSPLAVAPLGKTREKTTDRLDMAPAPTLPGAPIGCGSLSIWAADALQQIDPLTGKVLVGSDYQDARNGNRTYDGQAQRVALTALKGEQTDFQVLLEIADKPVTDIRLTPTDFVCGGNRISAGNATLGRVWYLKSGERWFANAVPVLKAGERLSVPAADNQVEGQKVQAAYVEIFVPYAAAAGEYTGAIELESSAGKTKLPVALSVLELTMPKRLSFEVELNQYADRQPKESFHDLHRLAHLHRVGYNVLPYSHNGTPTVSYVPPVQGWGGEAKVADWSAFDAHLGPLLNGSAFKDLPRAGEPLRWSYLPFYENYPMPLYIGYRPAELIANRPPFKQKSDYEAWRDRCAREEPLIDEAFVPEWFEGNRAVTEQFMRHFAEKNWTRTKFHVMCNNVPHKGALTSWTLDEPAWGRDFRALALFYRTFVRAARAAEKNIEVVGRNGVSRPEWQGDRLDEVSDFNDISGGSMRDYYPLIRRRMLERGDAYWTYGGGLSAAKDLAMLQALVVEAWRHGQTGILPAWTAFDGGAKGWDEDCPLALAVPAAHGYSGWTATLKLKALRRTQQDAELLLALAARPGWDRWRVARAVTAAIALSASPSNKAPENVTQTDYTHARQEDFFRLRAAVLAELLK